MKPAPFILTLDPPDIVVVLTVGPATGADPLRSPRPPLAGPGQQRIPAAADRGGDVMIAKQVKYA